MRNTSKDVEKDDVLICRTNTVSKRGRSREMGTLLWREGCRRGDQGKDDVNYDDGGVASVLWGVTGDGGEAGDTEWEKGGEG